MKYTKIKFIPYLFVFTIIIILFYPNKTTFAQTESWQKDNNSQNSKTTLGTVIPGGNVSGVFNIIGSPYYINGDITIPDQQTLSIDAGVEIIFNGNFKLIVQGHLIANGTAIDTIQFKPFNSSTKWRGIRFEDIIITNDTSKLSYCKITGSQSSDGTPSITNLDNGGGIYVKNTNKIVITHCSIAGNVADNKGGGIYISNSNIVFRNNSVSNNIATTDGGGIYATQNANGFIQSNKIFNNTAANAGGVMLDACNGLIFNNNLISYNNATLKAGGIYFANGCNGKYANNTISRNKCIGFGDGIYISASNPSIYNTIIWYNEEGTGANVYINNDGAVPNFYYSNIQNGAGSFAGVFTGNYLNNVDYTPGFWGWGNDYFDLNFMSPSINRGTPDTSNLNLPKLDILGGSRCYNNGSIDIGAYEFQGNQNWNTISGNLSGTLTTAGTPYYVTNNIVVPEGQTLILERGIQLYFLGHFSITVKGTLIANGDESESVFFSSLDTMDYHKTNLNNGAWNRIIIENTSTNTEFNYCEFQFSKAVKSTDVIPYTGGSVVVNGCSAKFYNCHFYFSLAQMGGGLAVLNSNKTTIENCKFNECRSLNGGKGAALYIENASPTVFGNLFISNTSDNLGGVVYVTNSESNFINNTIAENSANKGGAFYINEENSITLKNKLKFYNNIIWLNTASVATNGDQIFINSPTDSISFSFNDIMGGLDAVSIQGNAPFNGFYHHNIDADPHFMYSCPTPYGLLNDSPCINAGTEFIPGFIFPLYDIFGNPRMSGKIDMGAYEGLIVSIDNINVTKDFCKVFPNPCYNKVSFTFSMKTKGNVTIIIYDTNGKLMKTVKTNYTTPSTHQLDLNVKDLQKGVYYYQLIIPDKTMTGKLLLVF